MASVELHTTSNLLRYVSEWDPREKAHTKGGYIDGKIKIPNEPGKLRMTVQTYPADDVPPIISNIHPCLLHVVRIGKGKRDQDSEPVPTYYHWKQEFLIENGIVKICNRVSNLDFDKNGKQRPVPLIDTVTQLDSNGDIVLGRKKDQLNLIILQPKQQTRAKPNEATVTDVLTDRLCQNKELEIKKIQECENLFKGRENAKNLKKVRLKVDFYNEMDIHCGSAVSPQTIIDTGSKEIGSMDFYDATPHKSCVEGGRKVIMVSEYNLDKNVAPIFQVFDEFDEHHPELDTLLIQPNKFSLKNQTIVFITPPQPRLQEIRANLRNFFIKLLAKRGGDGYTSNKTFNFTYLDHKFNCCPFCDFKIDTDDPVQIEAGIERPRPGIRKRRLQTEQEKEKEKRERTLSIDEMSSGSSLSVSPRHDFSIYEIPVHSIDSGIDSRGYTSDDSNTSHSDFEQKTMTQDDLTALTKKEKFVMVDSDVDLTEAWNTLAPQMQNQNQLSELIEELKVSNGSKMEEIPSEAFQSIWGQPDLENPLVEDIMNIDEDDLIHLNMPELNHSEEENYHINNWSSQTDNIIPSNVMMTQRDPVMMMAQRDSTITEGPMQVLRNHVPVVLQQRIQSDSAAKQTDSVVKSVKETVLSKNTGDGAQKIKREKQKADQKKTSRGKKLKADEQISFVENVPIFTLFFMLLLVIFKFIGDISIEMSHFVIVILSMAVAIFMIFLKNNRY